MGLEKHVIRYKSGDEKAFDDIYSETFPLVRFAIYQIIPNKYVVEDLTQEVFMKVVSHIQHYSEKNFKAWIYRVAKNSALDYLKKKKEIISDDVDFLENTKKTHPYLYYAIRHLSEQEREVFLMKVLYGHTTKKIAQILDLSPSVINQIYYDAKEKLKKSLEEND